MKFAPSLLLCLFMCAQLNAQALFEKGYYINTDGQRFEGLIDVGDLNKQPVSIFFKSSYSSETDTLSSSEIAELKVSGYKFVRFQTDVFIKSEEYFTPDVIFESQSLLLRVEVEGSVSLYSLYTQSGTRFFYSENQDLPTELVYDKYIRADGRTATNNHFRNQLSDEELGCVSENIDYDNLTYDKSSLKETFFIYNNCLNAPYNTFEGLPLLSMKYLNFGFSVGSSWHTIKTFQPVIDNAIVRFDGFSLPTAAFEIEYLIPALFTQTSLFTNIGYQSFSGSKETFYEDQTQTAELNYQVIQTSVGFRYNIQLVKNFKLFADLAYAKDFEFGDGISIDYTYSQDVDNFELKGHINAGIGLAVKNRYILEARGHHFNTQLSDFSVNQNQRVTQSIFSVSFKYLLKSYYK